MAAAAPSPYRILGQGSFGRVISPALPNIIDGRRMEFPDQVTKLFFNRNTRNKAVRSSAYIQQIVGEDEHLQMTPYTHEYKVKNIPQPLLHGLSARNFPHPDHPVALARAPYLGISVSDILYRYADGAQQLRTMPISKFLSEVAGLFHKTQSLYYQGMIHGDIRMPNVMYHPHLHFFTLIDYDLLMDMDQFYRRYPQFGYYSNPPESLIMNSIDMIPLIPDVPSIDLHTFEQYIINSYNEYKPYWKSQNIANMDMYVHLINESCTSNASYLSQFLDPQVNKRTSEQVFDLVYNHIFPYFDNYSLGLIILTLMEVMYPGIHSGEEFTKEIKDSLKRVLDPAVHGIQSEEDWDRATGALMRLSALLRRVSSFTIVNRLTPDLVMQEIKEIVQMYPVKEGGRRGARRRRRPTRHLLRKKPNARTHKKPAAKIVVG